MTNEIIIFFVLVALLGILLVLSPFLYPVDISKKKKRSQKEKILLRNGYIGTLLLFLIGMLFIKSYYGGEVSDRVKDEMYPLEDIKEISQLTEKVKNE